MKRALLRLVFAQVFVHASMAGTRMAAPLLALYWGYGPAVVGLVLALFALTQIFLALPAGRWVDRSGLRKPLISAVAACSFGIGLAAMWPSLVTLGLMALCAGGAVGLTSIALQRQVGRMAQNPQELREGFSWLAIGPAFSNFAGPVIAGVLIDSTVAFTLALGIHAASPKLLGFQVAFAVMAVLPWSAWFLVRKVPDLAQPPKSELQQSGGLKNLVSNKAFIRLLGVNWLMSAGWDVHSFIVPILGHERGFSATTIGTLLGAFALAATMVRLCLPWLSKHVQEWRWVLWAMLITSALFLVYPWLPNPWAMGVFSVLLGFSLGSVQPMILSLLHHLTPAHLHGQALGLRLMTINFSSVSMPLLFGAAGATVGVLAVFGVTSALLALGSRLAMSLKVPDSVDESKGH